MAKGVAQSWFLVLACLVVCGSAAQADWASLNAEVLQLYSQGKYSEAISIAEKAVEAARQEFGTEHPDYATSLNSLALLYHHMGKYEKAEPLYKQAIEIRRSKQGADHPDYATSVNNLAALYYDMGQYEKAEPLFKQTLEIRRSKLSADHPDYLTSLNNLANLYHKMDQYVKAEPLYKQAMEIRRSKAGADDLDYANSLNNLASLYHEMCQYEKAETLYKQAMEIQRSKLGADDPECADSLNNLAGLYCNTCQYEKAEKMYKQAMEIRRSKLGEDHPDYAGSLNNLAGLYHEMGHYEKAEPLYRQAIEIQQTKLGEDHPTYATSLNNLANLYHEMGQYDKSEPLYRQAMEIRRTKLGEEHPDYANSLNNLAVIYSEMDQYEKAEQMYKQAVQIRHSKLGVDHPDYAISLNNLAALYCDMGRYEEAEPLYRQAMEIRRTKLGEDHPDYATSLNNLAALQYEMGQYEKSEPLYKQAIQIDQKLRGEDHPNFAHSLTNLANLYAATGQPILALHHLGKGMLAHQRKMRTMFPSLTEREKQAYLGKVSGNANSMLTLCTGNSREEAFRDSGLDWSLRRKGIVLSSLLEDRERLRLVRDAATRDTIDKLKIAQPKLAKLIYAGPGKEGLEAHKKQCDELTQQIESMQKSLAAVSAAYSGNLSSTGADTLAVGAALPKGSALVELIRYTVYDFKATRKQPRWKEDRYTCFVLKPGEKTPEMIDLGEAKPIDEVVAAFRKSVESASGREAAATDAGKKLYGLVWSKVEPKLGGIDYVFLSPDGDLNLVSFAALPTPEGKFLGEKYVFNTLASGRDILRKPIPGKASAGLVAFANPDFGGAASAAQPLQIASAAFRSMPYDRGIFSSIRLAPLPGTKEETDTIASLFTGKGMPSETWFGPDATEARVKAVSRPKCLHTATHGFFLADSSWMRERADLGGFGEPKVGKVSIVLENPMHRSGLAFAGANRAIKGEAIDEGEDDGLLTAEEVVTMDLEGTDLVTLSACETGLGEVKRGEGVMGLRRAFVMTGCNALVMSLWNVPDKATRDLMVRFYELFLESGDAPRSLAKAQREAIASRRRAGQVPAPYYWGAFVATSVVK